MNSPRCEHCGEPAGITRAGGSLVWLRFRGEPVCPACYRELVRDDPDMFFAEMATDVIERLGTPTQRKHGAAQRGSGPA